MTRVNKIAFSMFFILATTFMACKKERSPKLTIHVQEKDGTPAIAATVHAFRGTDPPAGIDNPIMDKTTTTDGSGDAVFNFKFSAVLDVDVKYFKTTTVVDSIGVDSFGNTIFGTTTLLDTLSGHRVVKIEALRQRSKTNDYNETVEVQ